MTMANAGTITAQVSDVLALVGVLATGLLTYLAASLKLRTDRSSIKADRFARLEQRVDELQERLDREVATRRLAERYAYRAGRALERAIDYIREVSQWIERGQGAPPPAPDISELEKEIPPAGIGLDP